MRRVLVLSLLSFGLACAEPSNATVERCVAQCDAAGDCPGGSGDCLDVCESQYAEAERIECVPEYQAILDCIDGLPSVCDPSSCSNELTSYTLCLGAFCATNTWFQLGNYTDDPVCPQEPPPDGTGAGGGS